MTQPAGQLTLAAFLAVLVTMAGPAPAWAQKNIQQVFEKTCASCHGADGAGKTEAAAKLKIPDLRSKEVQQLSDKELFDTIAYGTGHKQYPHAWLDRGINGALIRDLVDYVRQLAKPPKRQARTTP